MNINDLNMRSGKHYGEGSRISDATGLIAYSVISSDIEQLIMASNQGWSKCNIQQSDNQPEICYIY